jgi:hypothetical protein
MRFIFAFKHQIAQKLGGSIAQNPEISQNCPGDAAAAKFSR